MGPGSVLVLVHSFRHRSGYVVKITDGEFGTGLTVHGAPCVVAAVDAAEDDHDVIGAGDMPGAVIFASHVRRVDTAAD